ncbi:hypothetical protein FH972_024445 [Carpinus fangiana]|uniref:Zn(2)-C6 fungal-type domain-containing protein n=1 Tax=Carpinus fangiana TaxID=176857 RepID=A0A5N6KY18_9ROSI|nr:hypothetical protein FH972_024445 [Carpinus fangiana]
MDGDESEDLPVPSRRRGRLETPRRSSIEEADLQEDLEFLAPSDGEGAVVDEDTPRPGRPRSAVKTAKQKALDMLKRKRQKSNTGLSSDAAVAISDDDDEDDAYATEDEEPTAEDWNDPGEPEEDWIVDEEDAEPVEMPVEFRLRTMKPKELFKIAVEWYVQKKINPGFDRDNNAYHIAFLRLSDFVTGMGGSKYRSSVWTPMFLRALLARPILEESHFAGDAMMRDRCDACNRSGHPATYEVRFQGKPYDKHSLEEFSDDEDDTGQETELPSAGQVYYIGKFCMRNARVAHQLHHWQFHLGEWISDYLDEQGHLTPEKILRRDGQSTRKRHRAANKIVEKMDESGEIKTLYRDFKHEIDAAQTGEAELWKLHPRSGSCGTAAPRRSPTPSRHPHPGPSSFTLPLPCTSVGCGADQLEYARPWPTLLLSLSSRSRRPPRRPPVPPGRISGPIKVRYERPPPLSAQTITTDSFALACFPCRQRKVKCDLGKPDDPSPPCLRCRRESKECTFALTRRKAPTQKRSADDALDDEDDGPSRPRSDSFKRVKTDLHGTALTDSPRTPGGSVARNTPLRRPSDKNKTEEPEEEEDTAINDDTAELLQRSEMHNGPDAMAALATIAAAHGRSSSINASARPTTVRDSANAFGAGISTASPIYRTASMDGPHNISTTSPYSDSPSFSSQGKSEALRAWSRVRFVRSGMFTAAEGVAFVQYFYRYLNPLTPVTVPHYQDPSTHARLLTDEPVLAVTLLTIASRYMKLTGPGADTRAFTIHEKLWIHLKAQIQRVYLGQEQFGGGFCGAGRPNDYKSQGQTSLRTLGTVESLLLLTEWHARALHFPPGADSEELLDEDFRTATFNDHTSSNEESFSASAASQQIDHWLEPCWRSDRMVWSLLSSAISLAAELGVFTHSTDDSATDGNPYNRRRENVRRLIYIYVTQTSGRLSLPSLIPDSFSTGLFANGQPRMEQEQARTPFAHPAGPTPPHNYIQEINLYFWHGICKLFQECNTVLFATKEMPHRIISDGSYVQLLQRFESSAQEWQREFRACKVIPTHMCHILNIEYEYARVYANSLALTAVVERCTANTSAGNNGIIPPGTLFKSVEGDRRYLQIIVKASQNLLRSVVEGLLPHEYLKHSPARTYIRIIAVSMMLLKTIALGAAGDEVDQCIKLLRRATSALRTCVVDDVHVSTSVAGLIEVLTQRASARLVRIRTKKDGDDLRNGNNIGEAGANISRDGPGSRSQTDRIAARSRQQSAQQASNNLPTVTSPTLSNSGGYQTYAQPYAFNSFSENITSPAFDPLNPNFSIMPPASYNASEGIFGSMSYENFDANNLFSPGVNSGRNGSATPSLGHANVGSTPNGQQSGNSFDPGNDWVALPLDALFNHSFGNDVTQTGYGPDVGGRDMLNLLLMDDPVASISILFGKLPCLKALRMAVTWPVPTGTGGIHLSQLADLPVWRDQPHESKKR